MLSLLVVCATIPTYYHWNSFRIENVDESNLVTLTKNVNEMINQCGKKSIFNINKNNFYVLVMIFWMIFCCCIWLKNCKCGMKNNLIFLLNLSKLNLGKFLTPLEPFGRRNVVETSALLSLVMIDILISLEQTLIDIKQLWIQGVIHHFAFRAFIPLLNRFVHFIEFIPTKFFSNFSLRYYPIFLSLQQHDRCVLSLSIVYILCIIGYVIIRGCSCLDFLPVSSIFTLFDQMNTYVVCYKNSFSKISTNFHLAIWKSHIHLWIIEKSDSISVLIVYQCRIDCSIVL